MKFKTYLRNAVICVGVGVTFGVSIATITTTCLGCIVAGVITFSGMMCLHEDEYKIVKIKHD